MGTRKTMNILLTVVFCLCLVLPLAFADFEGGKPSAVENRFLAHAPRVFTPEGLYLTNIKTNFEGWLDDNVGGRSQMVAANTWLHYHLFRQSVHRNTLLGKEDWTYYINNDILRDYQHANLLPEEELTTWVESLQKGGPGGPSSWDGYVACVTADALLKSWGTGAPEPIALRDRHAIYD